MLAYLLPLLASLTSPAFAIDVSESVYFANLATNLTAAGLNLFANALTVDNTTQSGQALLGDLYQDKSFTIYAPVDAAWEASGLQNPPANQDLTSLLSYHIVGAEINSTTDVAAPRQHTIYETALRTETVLLPGDRHQVIVLEQATNATDGTILIRGDSWNATSSGAQITYENLKVQPIDRVGLGLTCRGADRSDPFRSSSDRSQKPSPLIKTLSQSGLALRADLGATDYVDFASELNLSTPLEECVGCTFFVPVNDAFQTVNDQVSSLNTTEQTNLLNNHVLNGTLRYSTQIGDGFTAVTAAGSTLAFTSNSSGSYYISGGSSAKILRADIPVSNGVVHLIDAVFVNTAGNAERAAEAVSSASSAAATATGGSPVVGTASASTSAPAQSSGGATALNRKEVFAVLSLLLAASCT